MFGWLVNGGVDLIFELLKKTQRHPTTTQQMEAFGNLFFFKVGRFLGEIVFLRDVTIEMWAIIEIKNVVPIWTGGDFHGFPLLWVGLEAFIFVSRSTVLISKYPGPKQIN